MALEMPHFLKDHATLNGRSLVKSRSTLPSLTNKLLEVMQLLRTHLLRNSIWKLLSIDHARGPFSTQTIFEWLVERDVKWLGNTCETAWDDSCQSIVLDKINAKRTPGLIHPRTPLALAL